MIRTTITIILIAITNAIAFGQESYSLVFLTPSKPNSSLPNSEIVSIHQAHLQFMDSMKSHGNLLLHGRLAKKGEILLLNTNASSQANEWINNDPAIKNGFFRAEVITWTLRNGKICEDESSDYITFTLVKYITHITKFNVRESPQLLKQHEDYIALIATTGNIVMSGDFTNSDGGMMIVKGEITKEVIYGDPTVESGFIEPSLYRLTIRFIQYCSN